MVHNGDVYHITILGFLMVENEKIMTEWINSG